MEEIEDFKKFDFQLEVIVHSFQAVISTSWGVLTNDERSHAK